MRPRSRSSTCAGTTFMPCRPSRSGSRTAAASCSGERGTMARMATFPDDYRDLPDAQFATLATVEPDGTPQLSEIWFLHEDGQLRLSPNTARRQKQNLMQRDHCSLMIVAVEDPYPCVELRDSTRFDLDDDPAFAGKLHGKYNADVPAPPQAADKRVVLRIERPRIRQ